MSINVDIIVKVIIPILGAILTYLIWPLIKSKTTVEQRKIVEIWAKTAVEAAEQMQDAGLLVIPKKDFVLDYLRKQGFQISEKDLDIIVEAAVKQLNLEQDKLKQSNRVH